MTTLYGISNCDTVKKARAWLTAQRVDYTFHDFKKQGVPKDRLAAWCKAAGWEKLLNRHGTTWRKLDADVVFGVRVQIHRALGTPFGCDALHRHEIGV